MSEVITNLLDQVFDGSVREMLRWQNLPDHLHAIIELDCDQRGLTIARAFSRPDLIVSPDGPRVLEVNFGSSNGGLAFVDTIQARFEQILGKLAADCGIRLNPARSMASVGRTLAKLLRCAVADTDRNHIAVAVTTVAEAKTPKGHLVDFCKGLEALGYRVTLALFSDIEASHGRVQVGGEDVNAIYCMCTFAEMLRANVPMQLLRDLIRADRDGTADFIGAPGHVVFDSKANLALVHDPVADKGIDADRLAWARRVIAPTWKTTARPDRAGACIYKPLNDFGGNGISFTPPAEPSGQSNYIAQEIVENACLWFDGDGELTRHTCFGPSVTGGEVASIVLRALVPNGHAPIINARQGAAVGPALANAWASSHAA
ncbi:hypothetical protein [Roseibium sp.]|uniref:hypothetical protein n=1 Tax=Roseibium sp. TaxID=1936156 RepID=UPI00351554F7